MDHGVSQFSGLQTIDVMGAPLIIYCCCIRVATSSICRSNIELLSRYGADDAGAQLINWAARDGARKAR